MALSSELIEQVSEQRNAEVEAISRRYGSRLVRLALDGLGNTADEQEGLEDDVDFIRESDNGEETNKRIEKVRRKLVSLGEEFTVGVNKTLEVCQEASDDMTALVAYFNKSINPRMGPDKAFEDKITYYLATFKSSYESVKAKSVEWKRLMQKIKSNRNPSKAEMLGNWEKMNELLGSLLGDPPELPGSTTTTYGNKYGNSMKQAICNSACTNVILILSVNKVQSLSAVMQPAIIQDNTAAITAAKPWKLIEAMYY